MEGVVRFSDGADTPNENGASSDTIKIPERLLRREQERQEEAGRRREARENTCVSEEKLDYFSSSFGTERAAIEEVLSSCSAEDAKRAAQVLEEASSRMQQLQKFVNDSMPFLTQYELRQAQASLQRLQCALAEKREEVLPKKKFAFRPRNAAAARPSAPSPPSRQDPPGTGVGTGHENGGTTVVDGRSAEQCGFSNAVSQVLIKGADELRKRDVLLTHLTDCRVRLHGAPSTLHIKHVRNSEILCGPVSSSVFVDDCRGCTFALSCQQLRTHNTSDTRVYLHVTSRAIIEDCSGVSFAPYSWTYDGIDADFEVSGLDRGRNNWTQVDDFNWLAAGTPSPNWTVIPESERRMTWD